MDASAEPDLTSDTDSTAPIGSDAAAETSAGIESSAPAEPYAEELSFALEVAARAGRLLMDRYERVERIDYKSARDVVTEVDHMSEELILDAIRSRFPTDGILAEESGEHHAVAGGATSGSGRTWVVDPVDGTINYANGIPFFCVSIALVVDGRPSVGVIYDPTRGETFSATVDGPALLDGAAITVSEKEQLIDFVVSMALSGTGASARSRAVRRAIRVPRSMGSAALALAYVANGRFDAFVQTSGLSAWDVAAAGLIAERGGAKVTDLAGGRWFEIGRKPRGFGVVAAPPAHHRMMLAFVSGAAAPAGRIARDGGDHGDGRDGRDGRARVGPNSR